MFILFVKAGHVYLVSQSLLRNLRNSVVHNNIYWDRIVVDEACSTLISTGVRWALTAFNQAFPRTNKARVVLATIGR